MMVTLESEMHQEPPVPTGLATVRSFINTRAWDPDVEELDSTAALTAWLADHELAAPHEPRTDADLERARRVREALRALAAGNTGETVPGDAVAVLEEQRRRSKLGVTFGADGSAPIVAGASGIDGALGTLLAIVAHAIHDDSWPRLKACADPGCRWAFYDSSRSHRRAWCSMEVCGNRNKVRAYRRRQRTDEPEPAGA
jgi:predicted RNA-binding Zn ribbon-like protein